MSYHGPSTSSLQSNKRLGQDATSPQSLHATSIHIHDLDGDTLLNIFHLYRPFLLGEGQDVNTRFEGGFQWVGERWWYRLAHVCQRWRNLILASASYLGLCLVCTYGTPVVDMLAHSPPLPLVIDYEGIYITAEDEEAIILALAQRDRVRRIRFNLPVLELQKIIMAIDGEYPTLEYLIFVDLSKNKSTVLILPESLEAPHLRLLTIDCSIPIRFQLLTTAVGLVALDLELHHPSTYFRPAVLLQCLSLMPQLEMLMIFLSFPVPNNDVERQLIRMPITTHVTLPHLRVFAFRAVSVYSEAVLSRITASLLEDFQIGYPNQLTFSVPELVQFMGRTENLKFDRAKLYFSNERVYVGVNPLETNMPGDTFSINIDCWHLDWQVSSVAQIVNLLNQIFSTVEDLTLEHHDHSRSSEEHNEVDRTSWRELLRSFSNVKTICIDDGLIKELSRCLNGEHPLELLPELQELTYSGSNGDDGFTPFIDARENAGRPVTAVTLIES